MAVVTLPLPHWQQIVSDLENACGTSAAFIEILASATVVEVEAS